MTTDGELLRRYADAKSEDAFAEIVQRHVNLVYSAALRQVNGDAHLARDVSQAVFTDLARKAASLSHRQTLTGWLYLSTCFAAAKAVRAERRRHARELKACAMQEPNDSLESNPDWGRLRPILDTVMQELTAGDREVILMRYFENRGFAEMGERLEMSEDGARKKTERAIERLRARLLKQGISASSALGTVLSANAVQTAPVGMAAAVSSASLATAAAGSAGPVAALRTMFMTKLNTGIASGLIVAGLFTSVMLQRRGLTVLEQQHAALQKQASQPIQPPARIQATRNEPALAATIPSLSEDEQLELLKLRSKAGMQRTEIGDLQAELAKAQETARARQAAATNYYPKAAWANAGNSTPVSALQSQQWESAQLLKQAQGTGRDGLRALITTMAPPELQAELLKQLANATDAEVANEIAHESDMFDKMDGLRIVNEKMISDDEDLITYMTFYNNGTNDLWGQADLKRSGGGWK